MADEIERHAGRPRGFERHEYTVNGLKIVVYCAGRGPPLVYWHGAGTFNGIDFAQPWTRTFRVICPYHPGFGESEGPGRLSSMQDLMLHYLDLFDLLGLERFDLVGISLGGWMATEFAVNHPEWIRRLVLAAPAGIDVPEYPLPALRGRPFREIVNALAHDMTVLQPYLPQNETEEQAFEERLARESRSFGQIAPDGPVNPALDKWLHRVTMPTLLLWGRQDAVAPSGRADRWMELLPNATLKLLDETGHAIFDESSEARHAVMEFLSG